MMHLCPSCGLSVLSRADAGSGVGVQRAAHSPLLPTLLPGVLCMWAVVAGGLVASCSSGRAGHPNWHHSSSPQHSEHLGTQEGLRFSSSLCFQGGSGAHREEKNKTRKTDDLLCKDSVCALAAASGSPNVPLSLSTPTHPYTHTHSPLLTPSGMQRHRHTQMLGLVST